MSRVGRFFKIDLMEKYQITGTQVSFRVNNEEREALNQLAIDLQTENNIVFNNSKDLIFSIIEKLKSPIQPQEIEVEKEIIPTALAEKFAEIKTSKFGDSDISEIEILNELQRLSTIEPKEIEVERVVERVVEKPLLENQMIIDLNPVQKRILEVIAERRFQKREDAVKNTPEKQLLNLTFNRQTLFNWAGNYPTYLELKEFSNK